MNNHPLIKALLDLRGNPRACVYTEPLWGIPYNLYAPFVSVYMAALLLTDRHIGIILSLSMLFQAVSALVSGAVTDKLGRKNTTFIFDVLSWSIPALLWMLSQNFWWFMVAAAFNGLWQITANSWTCLMVEDAEKSSMVNIYSLVHLSGHLAVIFAPLAGLMVSRLSIVPTMRILYGFTFLSMTAKFIILYLYCDETKVGKVRRAETASMSLVQIMSGYGKILRQILASPDMRLSLTIGAMFTITSMVMGTYFGLYTTGNLGISTDFLAYFPILRSLIIAFFIFGIQMKINKFGYKYPMLAGIVFYISSHLVLILSPQTGGLAIPVIYVILEGCAHGLVMPRRDTITALLINPDERARIISIMTVCMLAVNIPFSYLAGWLSDIDRRLSFCLNIIILILVFVVIARSKRLSSQNLEEATSH